MTYSERKNKGIAGGMLRKLIAILALGVFLFSAVNLLCIYQEYKAGTQEYEQLERYTKRFKAKAEEETPEASAPQENVYETMENPIDFESLMELNSDIIGWIEMEGIDVFYPIMQAKDNDYYLYRTFSKTNNKAGSLFADYRNNPKFEDQNTVIYGHNMRNGSMFGHLKRYLKPKEEAGQVPADGNEGTAVSEAPVENAETDRNTEEAEGDADDENEALWAYEISPYFWIYTPEYIYKYEIYSVAEVGNRSKDYRRVFDSDEDYQQFIDRTVGQSLIETGVTVGLEDSVVTLSTCTTSHEKRLIVQGKRIETYLAVTPADGYASQGE